MINILFAAVSERWDQYQEHLKKELDLIGLEYKLSEKLPPSEVDYIISVSYTHLTLPTILRV